MATDAKVRDVEALLRESEWLREIARALARDEHSADDLVQETWVAALRAAPRATRNPRGWLTTVVRRLATKSRRAQRAAHAREQDAARAEAQPATVDVVERATLHRAVVDAVLALDEPYRATVLLRWFEGLPPRAIAQRDGVPVNTVRARLQRGLALLRKRLDAAHGSRAAWVVPLVAELPCAAAWIQGSSIGAMLMTLTQKAAVAVGALVGAWLLFSMSRPANVDDPAGNVATPDPVAVARSGIEPDVPPPQHDTAAAAAPRREVAPIAPVVDGVVVTGELVDERTLTPIAAAKVIGVHRHARRDDEASTTSTGTGTFELVVRYGTASALLIESADHAPKFVRIPFAVSVAPDGLTPVDAPSPVDVGRILVPRGARISGRVCLEANGAAVANATLLWAEVHAARVGSPLPLARPFATTRADGTFVATERVPPALDPETIVVYAFADEGIGWVEFAVAPDTDRIDDVVIPIRMSGALRVRVHDAAGLPVTDARVTLLLLESPFVRFGSDVRALETISLGRQRAVVDRLNARTDATGAAERRALPPGRYFVSVRRSGHHPVHRSSVDVVAGSDTEIAVELRAIADVVVAVRVIDVDGRAIQDARVELDGAEQVARTDADGRCRVGPTRVAARAVLKAGADGYAGATRTIDVAAFADAAATAATEPITIRLAKLAPIAGIVVDTGGAPVAGFVVRSGSARESKATTDASGRFRLQVAAGSRHDLDVRAPDRTWTTETARGVHAGDEHVRLVVQRVVPGIARLHAEIVASDGVTPAEFVRATLFPEHDRHDMRMRTLYAHPIVVGPHHVAASELAPGRYALTVQARAGGTTVCPFEVLPGEVDVRVRVVVGPPALIAGRLRFDAVPPELRTGALAVVSDRGGRQVDADGQPAVPAFIGGASVRADGDGRFWISGLSAGETVRLRLYHPSLVANAIVVPQPGGATPVELVVTLGGTVRFASATVLPAGRYTLLAGGSADAMFDVEFVDTDEPRVLDVVTSVAAGPFHWRLVGVTTAAPGAESRSIDVRGSDVATAGGASRVVVDVLR